MMLLTRLDQHLFQMPEVYLTLSCRLPGQISLPKASLSVGSSSRQVCLSQTAQVSPCKDYEIQQVGTQQAYHCCFLFQ